MSRLLRLPARSLLLAAVCTGAAAVLHAAPTVLTFTANDNVNWSDGIAQDGEGGSTDRSGITIQISNISDTNGTQMSDRLVVGHAELGDDFHALTTYEGSLATGSGWKGMQVASSGGADFQINGFEYWNYGAMAPITITVVGYRDGQQVASTSFQTAEVAFFQRANVSLDATFDAVDVVRLYGSGVSWHGINAIAIDDAVVPNAAPVVANLNGDSVSFTEGGSAVLLDAASNATVSDSDSADFSGGAVTAAVAVNRVAAEDVLSIVNQGSGAGQIGVSGVNVTYGGTTIGTYAGGTGTNNLVVTLNANATPTAAQALVRVLTYANTNVAAPSTATRTVRITVNDGDGGTSSNADVAVAVSGVNDAPTVANAIPNQNATEDAAFNFQFAGNTFADVDAGATLTYSAQRAGGGPLPAWLSFDAATRTFSGTPLNGDVGTISLDVIADDGDGGTVTDTFDIIVVNTNDAPTVANPIPNQNATEDAAFSFQFASNTFADADAGATLTYTAQLNGGGSLPAWLSFNAATRTFSGTPANANVGTVSIDVVANDGNGGTVTDTFDIVVANTNDAPTVVNAIPNQNATEDVAFNFQFASNTFADVDAGDTLTYVAQVAGGGALPAWLSFDSVTRTFSGTPGNGDVGSISFDVIADDGHGGTVTDTFLLAVASINDAPSLTAPLSLSVTEDTPTALTGISVSDVDAQSANVTFSASVASGSLAAASGGGVTVSGSGTTSVVLTATLANLNAFIAASQLTYTPAANATSNVTLSIGVDDGGSTGSGGSQSDSATVTLVLSAANDAPVNTLPAAPSVAQDTSLVFSSGNGTLISVSDVDAGGSNVQVTLTASHGRLTLSGTTGLIFYVGDGTSDATMTFDGTLANVNVALNGLVFTPTASYHGAASLQITSNDQGASGSGGATSDTDTLAITVTPINPTVTAVSSTTPDGTYKVGDTVIAVVTFDGNVTVDTTLGVPTLLLETGATDRAASYVSGSGSSTLSFSYVVQAGDVTSDLDYVSTAALAANGATIRNASSLDAVLTLPAVGGANALGGQKAIVVDGLAASVTSVTVPAAGTYHAGQMLDFSVQWSEPVTVDIGHGTPALAVTLDTGGTIAASYVSGSGSSALLFRAVVASGQEDLSGIAVGSALQVNSARLTDAAGNDAALALSAIGTTGGVLVDARGPQVTAVQVPADGTYGLGQPLEFTVTWSEPVVVDTTSGVPALLVTLDDGGPLLASYVSIGAANTMLFRGTVAAGQADATGVALTSFSVPAGSIRDAGHNDAAASLVNVSPTAGVLIDSESPGVAISAPSATRTSRGPVSFTITYTGATAVTLGTPDVTLLSTGTATGTILVSGSGATTRVVTVDQIAGTGTLAIRIAAATATDAGGNAAPLSAPSAAVQVVARDVTSLSPASGLASGGVVVTIRGVGFSELAQPAVLMGAESVRSMDVLGDDALRVVTPELPAGGAVDVVLLDGTDVVRTLAAAYTPLPAPASTTLDTDGDTLPDGWELRFGLDPLDPSDAAGDPDGDGESTLVEATLGTHPRGEYARGLAEGVVSDSYATTLTVFNPGVARSSAVVRYLPAVGGEVTQVIELEPNETRRLDAAAAVAGLSGAFSTWLDSDQLLVAEGLTTWGASAYGAGAEQATPAAATWYLAEGSTVGAFDLFYLLSNPTAADVAVDVTFLRPAPAAPITQRHVIARHGRLTLWVDTLDPRLTSTDVSAIVQTVGGERIVVERAMYRQDDSGRWGSAGHRAAGVSQPSTTWHFAEGFVGAPFDTYLLIANPQTDDAAVDVEVFGADGIVATTSHVVAAQSRLTVSAAELGVPPGAAAFTIRSTNGRAVVAERAMWWPPSPSAAWVEAHASAGQPVGSQAWGLADLRAGGTRGATQYVLLQNLETTPVQVDVVVHVEGVSTPVTRTYGLAAQARLSIDLGADVPEALDHTASAVVRSTGRIVVEASRYWDVGQVHWAAGVSVGGVPLR